MLFQTIQEEFIREVHTRHLRDIFKARKYEEDRSRREAMPANLKKLQLEDMKRLKVAILNDADFIIATLNIGNRFTNAFEYYYDDEFWREKHLRMQEVLTEHVEPEVVDFFTQPIVLRHFPAFETLLENADAHLTYGDLFREHSQFDKKGDAYSLPLVGDHLYERPNPMKFDTSYWPGEGLLFSAMGYIKRWEHDFAYTAKIREKRGGGKPDMTELELNYDLLLFDLFCVKALRNAFKSKEEFDSLRFVHVAKGLDGHKRRLNLLLGPKVADLEPRVVVLQEVLQKDISAADSINAILDVCNQSKKKSKTNWPSARFVVKNETSNQRFCAVYSVEAETAIVFNDLYEKEDVAKYRGGVERVFEIDADIARPADGFLLYTYTKRSAFPIRLEDAKFLRFLKMACCKETLKKMFALELHDCVILALHCKRWKDRGEDLVVFLDLVMLLVTKWSKGKPVIIAGDMSIEFTDLDGFKNGAAHRKIDVDCRHATAMKMKTIFQPEQEKSGVFSCSAKDHVMTSPSTHGIPEKNLYTMLERTIWYDSADANALVAVTGESVTDQKSLLPSNVWPSDHCMVHARMVKGYEDDDHDDDDDDSD
jgi:hypothetical protein